MIEKTLAPATPLFFGYGGWSFQTWRSISSRSDDSECKEKKTNVDSFQQDDGESTPAAAKNSSTEARTGDALERDGQAEVDAGDRLAPSSANSGGVAGGNKRLAPPPPGAKHAENGNVAGGTSSPFSLALFFFVCVI